MLTQSDLEQFAIEMRNRGLRSSWIELIEFSQSVVGNLVDAYQTVLIESVCPVNLLSDYQNKINMTLRQNLVKALTSLAGEEQVARWESEALTGTAMQRRDV